MAVAPPAAARATRLAHLAAELVAASGKIASASADGGADPKNHSELWAFQQAGMLAGDVLRTATMVPAEKLGLEQDLGSLEVGKLADLLVLGGNPLEHVEHTLALKYTVLAGIIYDSETLAVISPRALLTPMMRMP